MPDALEGLHRVATSNSMEDSIGQTEVAGTGHCIRIPVQQSLRPQQFADVGAFSGIA